MNWLIALAFALGALEARAQLDPVSSRAFGPIHPVLSPDGRSIALSYQGAICSLPSGGGRLIRLTHGEGWDIQPAWSPDGRTLAFVNAPAFGAGLLGMIRSADGSPVPLPNEILARGPLAFHPDGQRLIGLFAMVGNPDRLQWLELKSGKLTRVDVPGGPMIWALSPDGSSLLLATFQDRPGEQSGNNGPSTDLWLVAATGGERKKIARWPSRIYGVEWDAPGRGVFVVTDRGTAYNDIWHIPMDQPMERARKLTFGQADEDWPSASRDGQWLLYTDNHTSVTELVRMDLESGERTTLVVESVDLGRPSGTLRLVLSDAETGQPIAARVSVNEAGGKFHFPVGAAYRLTSGAGHFYARTKAELRVPAGRFTVRAWHGPEYGVEEEVFEVAEGQTREISPRFQRWVNMPARRWFSGENHIHANYGYGAWHNNPATLREQCEAEDLHVANVVVANSDGDAVFDRQYFLGRPDPVSAPRTIIYWNQEFRSTIWGHLTLGNLSRLVEPIFTGFMDTTHPWDVPTNADIAEQARVQTGSVSYTHPAANVESPYDGAYSAKGLPVDVALGRVDTLDVMGPGYNASLAVWYRLLNCGFRLPGAAGTDVFLNRIPSYPPGWGRCYVHVAGDLTYEDWTRGQKAGRSFVTTGPMLDWRVEGHEPGDTLALSEPRLVRVHVDASAQYPLKTLEFILDGVIVATNTLAAGRREIRVERELRVERSGWLAVRCTSSNRSFPGGDTLAAHGNPVYIEVRGKPARPVEDAKYFLAWIDRLQADLKKRDRIPAGLDHVRMQLDAARAVYQKLSMGSAP